MDKAGESGVSAVGFDFRAALEAATPPRSSSAGRLATGRPPDLSGGFLQVFWVLWYPENPIPLNSGI